MEWIDEKGYGFVATNSQRFFIHVRDFSRHHKRPAVGDAIRFTMGQDAKGRPCAVDAIHVNDGGRITGLNVLLLSGLLVLPVLAVLKLKWDWRWIAGIVLTVNALAFYAYAVDKQRAWKKLWRLPETRLQLLALIGGWPGAYLAQCYYRHKCAKLWFQIFFWLIVFLYQWAGFDCLNDWQYSRTGLEAIRPWRLPWRS